MPEPTIESLITTLNRLSLYYKYFQIDIGDGIFVNNKTVQIEEIANEYKKINDYKNINFDFHLMVSNFEKDILKLNSLKEDINIKNIFIHYSAISDFKIKISNLSLVPIGLTLNPEDQVNDLISHYNLKEIPSIQIMSVVPGVQGNPFIKESLTKIEQLRLLGYKSKIFLDGAVNDKTISIIANLKFPPDVICPGSYLTKTNELKSHVDFLSKFT